MSESNAPLPTPLIGKLFQQGVIAHQRGQLAHAKVAYEQVLAKQPNHFDALHFLGVIAHQSNCHELALELIARAISVNPNHAAAHSNHGIVLQMLNRLDDALTSYDRAIEIKSDYAEAFYNRGNILSQLMRFSDALASYDRAIEIKADYAEAFYNRGNALTELKRPIEGLASYEEAIVLKPNYAEAFNNRGNTLGVLERLDEALASFDKAIALNPDYAEAHCNRGNILGKQQRLNDALASYDRALTVKPDYAEAFFNRGNVLTRLKRLEDALTSYDMAIALKSNQAYLYGTRLFTQIRVCEWDNLDEQLRDLERLIMDGNKASPPFPVLGLIDKPEVQFQASKTYVQERYPDTGGRLQARGRPDSRKIRLGYFSADFHNHATAFLMAELFEAHDRREFEVYGFSFGPDKQDEMRRRISCGVDCFLDVKDKSNQEVVAISRDLGIDIGVDLKGFTQDNRMGIFAQRCAPIQINYLGYPGTSGASFFDYIIADETLIPSEYQKFFSEKVIRMPHSYQVNDSKRKIAERRFTRQEMALPANGFVFCCFNNNYKILPQTFDIWMRILKSVSGSVLWLLEDNVTASRNLRKEAKGRGVDPGRLVFADRMQLDEHLARHHLADLFLDTLPCNAHTTASDALWAGLPVLTLRGQALAARVATSLLTAMGLPELITETVQKYESRAIELANDSVQLGDIKRRLELCRLSSPLFDIGQYTRNIEAAYSEIHQRHLRGLAPQHIDVESNMS